MRETQFIQQNKEKWGEFESILEDEYKDPDKLNDLFIQITDDLSYSRTFYPNRSVRVYLNGLAQRIFHDVHKSPTSPWRAFSHFWLEELPQLYFEARRDMLIGFLIFALAFGIGVLSCAMDSDFPEIILGRDYMDMTEANIKNGDPMAVYKQQGMFNMALGITINNLMVALLTFLMGVFVGAGSIIVLIFNGVMVGVFQYFFIEKGLFWDSFLTIWIHGTIEISSIIVAGAAGITMGRGLAFPDTYSRDRAFQVSARRGMKMMIGIAPLIILAGFIEGFLTRNTDAPALVRGLFIMISLFFVLSYFLWYPLLKARIGFAPPLYNADLTPDLKLKINYQSIKRNGELFTESFLFMRNHLRKVMLLVIGTTAFYCTAVFALSPAINEEVFKLSTSWGEYLDNFDDMIFNDHLAFLPYIMGLCVMILCTGINRMLIHDSGEAWPSWSKLGKDLFAALPGTALLMLLFAAPGGITWLIGSIVFPIALLWIFIAQSEAGGNPFTGISRTFALAFPQRGRVWALTLILLGTGIFFLGLMHSGVVGFFLDVVTWVVNLPPKKMDQFGIVFLLAFQVFMTFFVFSIVTIGLGLMYYTLTSIQDAGDLWEKIGKIGEQRRIRGLERE